VGDRVHLKVRPEVSTLDYGNAVLLSGFRIPSLSTRRAETELELQNGQTFAIAGLMSNQMQTTMQKIPGIGDIPILGYLFKSKASKRDQTELVVMITPEILPNNSPGVTPDLPKYPDSFMPPLSDLKKTVPAPAPAFTQPSRSQAMAPATAPAVVDNRSEIERAQDRALEALDRGNQAPAATAAVAPGANSPAPETNAAQSAAPSNVANAPASVDAIELSKERRDLEKAAREQAERDAKVADKARAKSDKVAREQAKRDAEAAKVQAKRDAEAAKVQAKRDAEAAKLQAKQDEAAALEQAKHNAELARQQAEAAKAQAKADQAAQATAERQALDAKRESEREAERQRAIDAAAERLRAAEAEYQAELARRSQR
jgi:hypothetical protein